jgi:hypothetical protein
MECKIIFERDPLTLKVTDRIKSVKAPNGKRSILFDSIRAIQPVDNQDVAERDKNALTQYFRAYTPEFKQRFGDWENDKSLKDKLDENGEPLVEFVVDEVLYNIDENKPLDSTQSNQVESTTHNVLLSNIIDSNDKFSPLAKKLLDNPVEPITVNIVDSLPGNITGSYNTSTNTITVSNKINDKYGNTPTLIHEILHAYTHNSIKQGGPYVEELNRIYQEVLKYKDEITNQYRISNIDEFLVGIFTDPQFARDLQKLPSIDKSGISLWNDIMEWIKDFFNLIKGERTLFDDAFYISAKIIEGGSVGKGEGNILNNIENNKIQDLFNSSPELAKIGSIEQYSRYLDTIFPDSKVKDIVYHGTNTKFDKFDSTFEGTNEKGGRGVGFNFTRDLEDTDMYGDIKMSVLLNANKRVQKDTEAKQTPLSYIDDVDEIVVYDPEQIHILGSKSDIEGFKQFVDNALNNVKPDLESELEGLISDINEYYKDVHRNKVKYVKQRVPEEYFDYLRNVSDIKSSIEFITDNISNASDKPLWEEALKIKKSEFNKLVDTDYYRTIISERNRAIKEYDDIPKTKAYEFKQSLLQYTDSDNANNLIQYIITPSGELQSEENLQLARMLVKGLVDNTLFNKSDFPDTQIEDQYKLRNEDGSRKRYSENQAYDLARKLNKQVIDRPFKFNVIKVMGEKGDNRVYFAIKAVERNSDEGNFSLSTEPYIGQPSTETAGDTVKIDLNPFKSLEKAEVHTKAQLDVLESYNRNSGAILKEKEEVDITTLPKDVREAFEKKGISKADRYAIKTDNGVEIVKRRPSDVQNIIKVKGQTQEEATRQENAPKSVLARLRGTEMHGYNELILKELVTAMNPAYQLNKPSLLSFDLWAEQARVEFEKSDLYKELVGKARELFVHTTGINQFTEEEEVYRDSKFQLDKLVKSMMYTYHQAYLTQNQINWEKNKGELDQKNHVYHKPVFILEKPFLDKGNNEAGTMDVFVIFSDGTASIYDHKFTDLNIVRKEYNGSDKRELDRIYTLRAKQGLSTKRNVKNNWYYALPDSLDLFKKEESWNSQIGRYTEMVTQIYGVKGIRQARILPVTTVYTTVDSGRKDKDGKPIRVYDPEKSKVEMILTGLDDGGLSQIALDVEKTGDVALDRFIQLLIDQKRALSAERREKKLYSDPKMNDRIKKLDTTIQALLKERDINKVAESILSLTKQIKSDLEGETIDFERITNHIRDINMFKTFIGAAKTEIDRLEEQHKEVDNDGENPYTLFKERIGAANLELELQNKALQDKMTSMVHELNRKRGYMSDELFSTYMKQIDMGEIGKWMTHLRESNHPIVSMFSQLLDTINTNVLKERKALEQEVNKVTGELKRWGQSRGLKDIDIYKPLIDKNNQLIHKFSNYVREVFPDKMDQKYKKENIEWFKSNFKRNPVQEDKFQNGKKRIEEYYKSESKGDEKLFKSLMDNWSDHNDIEYNNGNNNAWFNQYIQYSLIPTKPEEYYTEEYKNLLKPENKPLLDYYNMYTTQITKLANKADFKIASNTIAEIRKDAVDTMVHNGMVTGLKQQGMNIYNFFTTHDKDDGFQVLPGQRIEDKKVPIFFTESVGKDNKLLDLSKSLMIFSDFVNNYAGIKDIEHAVLSMRQLLVNTQGIQTNTKGQVVRNTAGQPELKTDNNAKTIEAFDTWVNYYIYGEKRKGDPTINKAADTAISIASRKSVALNYLSAAAGHHNAEKQLDMIAEKSLYFDKAVLKNARVEARKLTRESLTKSKQAIENTDSKMFFTSMFFEISQEDLSYETANSVSISDMRKRLAKDPSYWFQRTSDDLIENTVLSAMLMDYGIDPVSGKTYPLSRLKEQYKDVKFKSLWDMTFMKTDSITMPDGSVKEIKITDSPRMINQFTGNEIDDKTFTDFRRKAKQMVARTKGNMSAEDIAGYKTHVAGRLIMQYRGWMPATIKERVKSEQYNLTMEQFEVGRWMAAYEVVYKGGVKSMKSFLQQMVPFMNDGFKDGINDPAHPLQAKYKQFLADNPHLTPDPANPKLEQVTYEQYYNTYVSELKALAKEVQIYLALTVALLAIMFAVGEDELEETPWLRGIVTYLDRVQMELGFFLPVPGLGFDETMEIFTRKPIAAFDSVTGALNIIENTLTETWDTLTGAGWKESTLPQFGDDPFSFDFGPRADKAHILYYSHQFIPPLKFLNSFLDVSRTTEKTDTVWDYIGQYTGFNNETRYK